MRYMQILECVSYNCRKYICGIIILFFKQKTAYEMRISDWSSDVCSSELLEDVVDADAAGEVQASVAVPRYYEAYEATFDLRVHRPVEVTVVCDRGERLRVETDAGIFSARGIINATGTRSEEHTSELQSLMRISYAVFCLKKKTKDH